MDDEDELASASAWGIRSHADQMRPQIRLPVAANAQEYVQFDSSETIAKILNKSADGNDDTYSVEFDDGFQDVVSYERLLALDGGQDALNTFENPSQDQSSEEEQASSSNEEPVVTIRKGVLRRAGLRRSGTVEVESSSDDSSDPDSNDSDTGLRTRTRKSRSGALRSFRASSTSETRGGRARRGGRFRRQQPVRRSSRHTQEIASYRERPPNVDDDEDEDLDLIASDLMPKRKRMKFSNEDGREGLRTSGRSTRVQRSMQEASMEDVYRSDSDKPRPTPKPASTKEIFRTLLRSDHFAQRHMQQCDTCERTAGPIGPLIYCQGCPKAYHRQCLGHRGSRDHLVTKIADGEFVLQCRRCINFHRRKDPLAPDHSICQTCRESGSACAPFRPRRTAAQELKEREENDGVDPIATLSESLVNNANNVLFRCHECSRAFHFHHLPSKTDMMDVGGDDETVAEERFREYALGWECKECAEKPAKVSTLIAFRPIDSEYYVPDTDTTQMAEDEKEYLVKWEKRSYFQVQWAPGAWVWGVTAPAMRKAFAKRHNERNLPVMTAEEAIPEDYLRIDIVLDVKYTSFVETRAEEIDKARIREVDTALIKYKGLGYEDAVWEKVPGPEDGDRWSDFVKAYDDWVVGRYVKVPKSGPLKARMDKAQSQDFNQLEKKEQPKSLSGGKLMSYQLDGVNWLYFRWHQRLNGILADEMGLGKTIQVIGLLATLVEDHNCFPFLLVVPNSTCPNWRREIKQWAPSLRVVTYFGSAQARRMAFEHELYPEGSKTLKCHVVVTSYDAAADDSCRKFFKGVPWQGLIVDEGQRLKSDKTNLYGALSALKIPFCVLLTGTPLQNNARELFNLLQFIDSSFDAAALDVEYEELTKANLPKLHDMIRPFFLRRTKAQVLSFLPSLAQVIVPVTMSVVQRKLYRSILSKNPDLLQAIFNSEQSVAKANRSNLNNILMQLRECLSHPFVYSQDIEERNVSTQVSHRNLVDASSKLQLLETLLPKLKEKGHRVLIFSQLLNMLDIVEDFLDGLDLKYQRLDGTMGSLEKQKRIDQYNAPGSELFAFLLSTRAGGVGINLATADTVIILDPDFNPHQDIQALSRAHRIGQTKKVLCFQLMTSASVEEKIMQIGRSKMALDHVLIEKMDASDDVTVDVESILKHGAAAILEGVEEKELQYDEASIERLLDRSQMENTQSGEAQTAESQFSFARVWANDASSLVDNVNGDGGDERAPDPGVWEKILQERERAAAEEASRRHEALGRGRRSKQAIDYGIDHMMHGSSPTRRRESSSDTDFKDVKSDAEDEEGTPGPEARREAAEDARNITASNQGQAQNVTSRPPPVSMPVVKPVRAVKQWRRSNVSWPKVPTELPDNAPSEHKMQPPPMTPACLACGMVHRIGYCPLKLAGAEHCNLCGLAHFGKSRTCPHIRSETQVKAMLAALKHSNEAPELISAASRYLQGVKGHLVQRKRNMAMKKLEGSSMQTINMSLPSHVMPTTEFEAPPRANFNVVNRPLAPAPPGNIRSLEPGTVEGPR